jgi:tripartite-type tricarboxylate transporter receptor subunit TctC
MVSSGIGTTTHIAGELLKMMARIDFVHVPYRGEPPALTDLLARHVQVMFANLPPSIEHIRAGRLRALSIPRSRNWRNPSTDLLMPNTGSGVCLRRA